MKACIDPDPRLRASLDQIASRMRAVAETAKPAALHSPSSACRRGDALPSGSPSTIGRLPPLTCATPGASRVQAVDVMPPSRRCGPTCCHSCPPGSSAGIWRPSPSPPTPWWYHQGMPFCRKTAVPLSPSRAAIEEAAAGSAGDFRATMTKSCGPSSAGSSLACTCACSTASSVCRVSPLARTSARVAPRANTLTWAPARASSTARWLPTAPAPKTQTFTGARSCRRGRAGAAGPTIRAGRSSCPGWPARRCGRSRWGAPARGPSLPWMPGWACAAACWPP